MIIASNFKTNFTRAKTDDFVLAIQDFMRTSRSTQEVRIFVPATALDLFDENPSLKVGAQNFYPIQNGSVTGEMGFEQLEEFEIDCVLIGHSERRHIIKESQSFIAQKFDFAKTKGVEIVYCVGEPKEIRSLGIDAVMAYIWEQFEGIDIAYERLVVAYEPVWAIGTGLSASEEDIEEVLGKLGKKLNTPLLYGGSVKTDNVKAILNIENCSGVLVGTASWSVEAFSHMIHAADELKK